MADDPTTGPATPTAAERRQARKEAEQREPRFTVAELRSRPEVLGLTAAELGLAFYDADQDEELTRAQANQRVEKALGREVERDELAGPTSDELTTSDDDEEG